MKNGDIVTAIPLGAKEVLSEVDLLDLDEYVGSKKPVRGSLEIQHVPADFDFNSPARTDYYVEGTPVNPDTIEVVEEEISGDIDIKLSLTLDDWTTPAYYVDYLRKIVHNLANDCHAPDSGQFCSTPGAVESIKLTATIQKTLNKELDDQGHSADSPIRGVIDHRGSLLAIARDPQGRILGAMSYTKDRDNVSTEDFRVLDEKKGTGTKIMQHLAQEALTTKDKSINLYNALQTAVPFYQKVGATFKRERAYNSPNAPYRFSSLGHIKGIDLEQLANGTPNDRRISVNDNSKFDENNFVVATSLHTYEFANPYHSPEDGRFCETEGQQIGAAASDYPVRTNNMDVILGRKVKSDITTHLQTLNDEYGTDVGFDVRHPTQEELNINSDLSKAAAWVNSAVPNTINLSPDFVPRSDVINSNAQSPLETEIGVVYTSRMQTYSDIITHEFGHVLTNNLSGSDRESLLNDFNDPTSLPERVTQISVYSTQAIEGIAEAFLMLKKGHQNEWTAKVRDSFSNLIASALGVYRRLSSGTSIGRNQNMAGNSSFEVQVQRRINEVRLPLWKIRRNEFSNPCHNPHDGRFCETPGASGHEGHDIRSFGLEDWPEDRRETVLRTVARLNEKYQIEKKYGVSLSINASGTANSAVQVGALAAVEDGTPTHIDFHPELQSQEWLEQNDPGTTVSSNNLEHIVIHEFGHVIEATIPTRLRNQLIAPFLEAQEDLFNLEDGKGNGSKFQNLITTISQYAGHNVNEGVAEAFLQHELGISNPYSDHVGEVLSRWKKGGSS